MTKEFPMTNAEFSLITRASGGESRGLPSRRQRGFHQLATLCCERNWYLGILVIGHLILTRTHWKCRGTQKMRLCVLAYRVLRPGHIILRLTVKVVVWSDERGFERFQEIL